MDTGTISYHPDNIGGKLIISVMSNGKLAIDVKSHGYNLYMFTFDLESAKNLRDALCSAIEQMAININFPSDS